MLAIRYRDRMGTMTEREVWPLGISYSDRTLFLLAWCCLRQDYRHFHVHGEEAGANQTLRFTDMRATALKQIYTDFEARGLQVFQEEHEHVSVEGLSVPVVLVLCHDTDRLLACSFVYRPNGSMVTTMKRMGRTLLLS